ncbi:MAG: hypothetical protein HYT10_00125 [Candidatus Levybacteria bacterium]|nr:hypothetical protein [Candidatus Levybacteria bacterium]
MSKYKECFSDMIGSHKTLFEEFKILHDNYAENKPAWKKEFDEKGQEVLQIIRRYERILCSHSESGKYGKFSTNLSDKFWAEVRSYLPKIDFVGVE